MGVCTSTTKKPVGVKAKHDDQQIKLMSDFQKRLKNNSFYNFTSSHQSSKEIEFLNSNKTPSEFIMNDNKFTETDKRLYSLCYSKCDPLLNNINEKNKKLMDKFFLNITFFMLSLQSDEEKKKNFADELIKQSIDEILRKIDVKKLESILRDLVNILIQIMVYIVLIFIYLDENDQNNLCNNDFKVGGKYEVSSLDKFYFDKLKSINKDRDMNDYIDMMHNFLTQPFALDDEKSNVAINDKLKATLIRRITHLLNSSVFYESIIKGVIVNYNDKQI